MLKFMATTVKGMEDVASRELRSIGGVHVKQLSERVLFHGGLELVYEVNLNSRTIHKLTLILGEGEAEGLDEIYRFARGLDYEGYIGLDQSFAIRTTRVGRHSYTSIEISSVVGKAVVDFFMELKGSRPRVDLRNPDVEVSVYVRNREVSIGINTTGESLHRRNYRVYDHPAALRTTLASCMLLWSGWRFEGLLDPMCGGATIPIEAALMARRFPPGFFRRSFAFKKLRIHDEELYREVLEDSLERSNRLHYEILGFDVSPKHLHGAQLNTASAGVDDTIKLLMKDSTKPDSYRGLDVKYAVVNPPYGIREYRLKALKKLYQGFLRALSEALAGVKLVLITGSPAIFEEAASNVECSIRSVRSVRHGDLLAKVYMVDVG